MSLNSVKKINVFHRNIECLIWRIEFLFVVINYLITYKVVLFSFCLRSHAILCIYYILPYCDHLHDWSILHVFRLSDVSDVLHPQVLTFVKLLKKSPLLGIWYKPHILRVHINTSQSVKKGIIIFWGKCLQAQKLHCIIRESANCQCQLIRSCRHSRFD